LIACEKNSKQKKTARIARSDWQEKGALRERRSWEEKDLSPE